MRILHQFQHEDLQVTLFAWNQKYILKFEKDNLEQTYKVAEWDTAGEDEVLEWIKDKDFVLSVQNRFKDMWQHWESAKK